MAETATATAADPSRPKSEWVKRKPGAAAYLGSGTVMAGSVDYAMKCLNAGHGHWKWVIPDNALALQWLALAIAIALPILKPLYFAAVAGVRRIPGANTGDDT